MTKNKKSQVQIESIFMTMTALITFALTVVVLFRNTDNLNVLLTFTQGELVATTLINRLISSPDCLAFEMTDYNILDNGEVMEYNRVYPGILDFEKFKNWNDPRIDYENTFNNFQCLSYWVRRPGVIFPSGVVLDYEANLVFNVTIYDAANLGTYTLKSGNCNPDKVSCTPYKVTLPIKIRMPDDSIHYGIMTTIIEFGWNKELIEENVESR